MNKKQENNHEGFSQGFNLPEDYFLRSSEQIRNKLEWIEEHRDFPEITALRDTKVFSVPANYFDQQSSKLELLDAPNLSEIKKVNPFSVPETYFKVTEEQKEISPFLAGLKKENQFSVPDNYFKNQEQKTTTLLSGRVIPLWQKIGGFAIAAMLILSAGLWIFDNYFAPLPEPDCGGIACVDKKDLLESKSFEEMDTEELFDLVDSKALEKSLQKKEAAGKKEKDTTVSEEDLLDNI